MRIPLAGLLTAFVLTVLMLLAFSWLNPETAAGVTAEPTAVPGDVEMMPIPDSLMPPVLPDDPTQADLGGQVYYYVCMACHGDRGQGLTPEWVADWGLEGKGCWESKCHASNHPPEGFELPKVIPPVVAPLIPARYETALELHDYIREKMPWHAPGSLTEQEYWQLTAYLVRENGFDPGGQPLDAQRAAAIRFRPARPTQTPVPVVTLQGGSFFWKSTAVVVLLAGLLFLAKIVRNTR